MTIESIKTFEPDSQRTLYPVNDLSLLPPASFDRRGRAHSSASDSEKCLRATHRSRRPTRDVSNGIFPGGIEFYLPLFFDAAETLFDHAPEHSVFALLGDVHATLTDFEKETRDRWSLLRGDSARPLLDPVSSILVATTFCMN